jgi:hypothetical protein
MDTGAIKDHDGTINTTILLTEKIAMLEALCLASDSISEALAHLATEAPYRLDYNTNQYILHHVVPPPSLYSN